MPEPGQALCARCGKTAQEHAKPGGCPDNPHASGFQSETSDVESLHAIGHVCINSQGTVRFKRYGRLLCSCCYPSAPSFDVMLSDVSPRSVKPLTDKAFQLGWRAAKAVFEKNTNAGADVMRKYKEVFGDYPDSDPEVKKNAGTT